MIHALVDEIGASIRVNGAKPFREAIRDPHMGALHRVFEEHMRGLADMIGPKCKPIFTTA